MSAVTFALMKMTELCLDDRPREKMLDKGPSALSNAELLAIMIRTGTGKMNAVDLARTLLQKTDGRLNEVADMSVEKLCSVCGIGPSKAKTLLSAFGGLNGVKNASYDELCAVKGVTKKDAEQIIKYFNDKE